LRKKEIVAGGEKLFHYLLKGIPNRIKKSLWFDLRYTQNGLL